jgi:hypothetical protein
MLKFGKRINYRPLLVSTLSALLIGGLFGFNISHSLGLKVGLIIFTLIFLGHYLLILPVIFNYWDSDSRFIRYNNEINFGKRIFTMIFPGLDKLTVIDKKSIKSITLTGLPMKTNLLSSALVVSTEGGFLYNLLVMMHHPVKLELTLTDGQKISLDLSQDYVYHPAKTLGKVKIFLQDFKPEQISLNSTTQHALSNF